METKSWKEIKDSVYGKKERNAEMNLTGILSLLKSGCF